MINKIISVFGAVRREELSVVRKRRSAWSCGWFAAAAMVCTLPAYSHSGSFSYDSGKQGFSASDSAKYFSISQEYHTRSSELCWDMKDPASAPEVDPASAGGALTLLAGALAMLRGRRRA
jgi:hypothetical protein